MGEGLRRGDGRGVEGRYCGFRMMERRRVLRCGLCGRVIDREGECKDGAGQHHHCGVGHDKGHDGGEGRGRKGKGESGRE